MKTQRIMAILGMAGIMALPRAHGTNIVITSFGANGAVTWTTALTNASYGVQWAPNLSAPGWTDSWQSLVGILPTGATYTASVPMFYRVVAQQPRLYHLPDWYPADPNVYSRPVFEITNFADSSTSVFTNEITGFRKVPYKSGTIVGVTNLMGDIFYNDGATLKMLGSGDWFYSTDTNLTAPPAGASVGQVYDGMIVIDSGYGVKEDLSEYEQVNERSLIEVQTVTVPAGTYSNAIIFWSLDVDKPFTPLDFHGLETEMGITLPTSSKTEGYSVTEFRMYGYRTGLIALGDIQAISGVLTNELGRLKGILPP
jgi:hypothetical protein